VIQAPRLFDCKIKTGDNPLGASCKKSLNMTSYGGIIRIRFKGRSLVTSSQPAYTSSPVFYYKPIIYLRTKKNKMFYGRKIDTVQKMKINYFVVIIGGCAPPSSNNKRIALLCGSFFFFKE